MTELVIRPLRAGEAELFLSMPDDGLVGVATMGRDFTELLAAGQYRPEWTWLALRGDTVVARAAWWAGPDDTEPRALDWFDALEPAAGSAVLRAAGFDADYCLILPPGWREQPAVRQAAELRLAMAERAGMRPWLERLRYRWTPADGLPDRPDRLVYRQEPDDSVIEDAVRRMHQGSLDGHTRRTTETQGAAAAVTEDMDFLRWMPSPRQWWRLAFTPAGDLVGLTVPGRNYASPVVALVGVVPEQRGHGYGYDLLVEATHLLVAEGVDAIVSETDAGNIPMAAAFARAGYPITQERIYVELPKH